MKLLIVTQAVDIDDPVLGFFHRWIEEFAKHVEHIEVICLKRGKFNFPENVRVHSLGKPSSAEATKGMGTRLHYGVRFLSIAWRLHNDYDTVFVHMNEEYVLIAGWLWKLLGKRVYLWRNHARGSWKTLLAGALSEKVFYTSPQSYTAGFKNAIRMPVGIDTEFFKPDLSVQKRPNSILFLGRIAPVKNVDAFIEVLNDLNTLGVEFSATIAGATLPQDQEYERTIRNKVTEYKLDDKVRFVGSVSQEGARTLYREHEIYVNLTPSGSMDKTIFEAMACGMTPVVANKDVQNILQQNSGNSRDYVVENHSLALLMGRLKSAML